MSKRRVYVAVAAAAAVGLVVGATGRVTAVDISSVRNPRLLGTLDLEGNPGIVVERHRTPVIPAGYQGLLVWTQEPRK